MRVESWAGRGISMTKEAMHSGIPWELMAECAVVWRLVVNIGPWASIAACAVAWRLEIKAANSTDERGVLDGGMR